MKYLKIFIEYILDFIIIHLFLGVIWVLYSTGISTGDQKIFAIIAPTTGMNNSFRYSYIFLSFIPSLILAVILLIIRRKKLKKEVYILLIILSFSFALYKTNTFEYLKNNIETSEFIEKNYVNPKKVKITFPNKKNLIYIYLESMENTYSSKDNGGIEKTNLIPNLTSLANNNISFSNTKKLGGALYLDETCFTTASMMAQTSGLPLKVSYSKNYNIDYTKIYNGYSLGDILYDNGYNNYIIMGSDSRFGARDYLYKYQHYKIYDVNSALKDKKLSKKDLVWWGITDRTLFKYAKEDLKNISKNNKPFNYTMLTVDTHFENGYLDSKCKKTNKDQYLDVINCNDKMLYDFISWIKKQDFYKDTVIILVGDHITMDKSYIKKIDNDYIRTTYNVFINVSKNNINTKNRKFTQMDMFPTTISAIGGKIEGERLSLGTNLFSNKKTLVERDGYNFVKKEINKRSEFYSGLLIHK